MKRTIKLIESEKLTEGSNYKVFDNEVQIENEFKNSTEEAYKFYDSDINYIGDMVAGNCKENSFKANKENPEENLEIYEGYIVLKDKNGVLCGIKHYFNVNNGLVEEHTAVRDTSLYKQGELQYYIGVKIKE